MAAADKNQSLRKLLISIRVILQAEGLCLQAGSEEDVGLAAGSEGAAATDKNESLSSYLVCLVEAPDASQSATADTLMALVAVETSTGSVLYDDFRCACTAV